MILLLAIMAGDLPSATTITLATLLFGSPVAGVLAARYLRPKQTLAEELDGVRADRDEDRERMDRQDEKLDRQADQMRRVTDYVHVLRQHIADGNPPPPPPWPEGIAR